MNGPQHYQVAEQLLGVANRSGPNDDPSIGSLLAEAQVHATLALVAATIEPAGWQPGEFPGWREAVK